MSTLYYICKYTPVELLTALGVDCKYLDEMPDGFDHAESLMHPNLCGFGKSILEAVFKGEVKELVLVDCCDSIKAVYDILMDSGKLDFLYMLDMLHQADSCSCERAAALKKMARAYGDYKKTSFDKEIFLSSFVPQERTPAPHIAVVGARMGRELFDMTEELMPYPVINETCVHNRSAGNAMLPDNPEFAHKDYDALMDWYAGELLGQLPCMCMRDISGRKNFLMTPQLRASFITR